MKKIVIILSMSVLLLSGCSLSNTAQCDLQKYNISNISTEDYLAAAKDVLTRMQFRVNKFDVEKGYLRTSPLQGAQLVEFWRKDNVGSFNTAEANISSIIRMVEIEFTCENAAPEIIVNVKRLALDSGEIVSLAQAEEVFASSESLVLDMDPEDVCWINLGRDEKLEGKIKDLICKKLAGK